MDIHQVTAHPDADTGEMGQQHLATGKQVALRRWEEGVCEFGESVDITHAVDALGPQSEDPFEVKLLRHQNRSSHPIRKKWFASHSTTKPFSKVLGANHRPKGCS